ncbi:MAG: DNA repair protein RecN [Anaerolineae bacterium]|nr:DNA repair protein RecN [Anaerolineae bacterium]
MLTELYITNFAIMDEVRLHFTKGFNIITGETGAGKSILIDAVDLALGGRSDASVVRSGEERATVTLRFAVPSALRPALHQLLSEAEIPFDGQQISLYREIRSNGRSAARINNEACKLPIYSEVGALLVDVHGQTEHLSLLKPRNHLLMLDRYANLEGERQKLEAVVRKLNGIRQTMRSLQQSERERAQRVDMLKYQISEIESARLQVDEEGDLRDERSRLANSEKIAALADDAYGALYGDDTLGQSGVDALNRASLALGKLAALDPDLQEESSLAESLVVQAEELARTLRRYREDVEVSPRRLADVEERLEVITRLKRKYGDSIRAVLDYAQRAHQELNDIELGEERLAELALEEDALLHDIGRMARVLSNYRKAASQHLAQRIVQELGHLRMQGTRFEVTFVHEEDADGCYVGDDRLAFDVTGIDEVEFLMSANPGEPLKPVAKIASGGETARIMLALKTALSAADQTPTLIFDEIDQGIGGRVGGVVGEKLWRLSETHQVLCVTHLPQIAGFADAHYRVSKALHHDRTTTRVMNLTLPDRIQEIAEMLGSTSQTAQQNAREIFRDAEEVKKGIKSLVEPAPEG